MTNKMTQDQDDNPHKRVVLNNVYKVPEICPEMINWSISSDNFRYVQHDKMTTQYLYFDTMDYRNCKDLYFQLKEEPFSALDVDFSLYPDITKARYLDVYEDVYVEMVYTSIIPMKTDLSTTYLGKTDMTRNTGIKAEERFPIHWSRVCFRKTTRWHGMSDFVRHRCYEVLHVLVILFEMQNSTMHYQNSLQIHREFRWEMDNISVYYL